MRSPGFVALVFMVIVAGCGSSASGPSRTAATVTARPGEAVSGVPNPLRSVGPSTASTDPHGTPDQENSAGGGTYRGGSARTGVMPGPGPVGAPVLRWVYQAPAPLESQPVVSAGRVYLV